MRQEIIDLYDDFTHSRLERRHFMRRLAELAGGTAAATAALAILKSDYARAAMVAADDARISADRVSFPSDAGYEINAYHASPRETSGPRAGVLVVHENRGLTPYIEDVTRRVATAGFAALGVDFLSPVGGTPGDEDKAREVNREVEPARMTADARTALAWLRERPDNNGKVGIVGFCQGGSVVGRVVVSEPTLDAAVVFYGGQPPSAEVPNIKAPLLLNYAGLDERVNAGIPEFEAALKAAGVSYELHIYEGAQHAFHNDTTAARYNAEAADLAWQRTIDFFKANLA